MAQVTAVANVKGGVGKTSLVINLGHVLAQRGHHVLLIDTDVQGAVAEWLGLDVQATLADALEGKVDPRAAITPARPHLDVVASGQAALRRTIGTLLGIAPRRKVNPIFRRMDRFIAAVDQLYDVILIDCAPSLDFVMEAVYPTINDVLVPTSMTGPSIENMELQLDTIQEIRQAGHRVRLKLIVPTLVRADDAKHRVWLEQLAAHYGDSVAGPIHYDPRLEDQNVRRQTVLEAAPDTQVARDYQALAQRYLSNP
jgi:chromosome partitioning protein